MRTSPKISVIIPIYNKEKFLSECLDSVIKQTLQDIEIICIDDGSKDKSWEILQKYAKNDDRFIIARQKNSGAACARNKGIDIAKGEYIAFVDADDFVDLEMLKKTYNKAKSTIADILVFEVKSYYENLKNFSDTHGFCFTETLNKELFSYKDIDRIFQFCWDVCWNKLYRTEFIKNNDIRFQDLRCCNDTAFSFLALVKADRIATLNDVLYFYRENTGQQICTNRQEYVSDSIKAIVYIKEKLIEAGVFNQVQESFKEFCISSFKYNLDICRSRYYYNKFKHELNKFLNKKEWKQYYDKRIFEKSCPKINYKGYFKKILRKTYDVIELILLKLKFNQKLKKYPLNYINKDKLNKKIKKFNACGINKDDRSKKVIISLTSFPERMYDIHFALYSLLNQTFKPDDLVLWLGIEEFPNLENDIPENVLKFKKNGLKIKWCNDIKSYKKLIPALQEYPNDLIVTADDDLYYPNNWLELLYNAYLEKPDCIHCHRAHRITLDEENGILPYKQWQKCISNIEQSFLNFATTGGGVLYPSNILYHDVLDENLFIRLCPDADDLWFWAMAVLKGTKINIISNNIKELIYINPERELGLNNEKTLYSSNFFNGGNDLQLRNLLKHYNQILRIITEHIIKF